MSKLDFSKASNSGLMALFGPGASQPGPPPNAGKLDFSKARNSGLLALFALGGSRPISTPSGPAKPFTPNCPVETAQWLNIVQALLPKGPAWLAATIPGTTMYAFWFAVASVFAWIESILCGFYNELFCSSASDTIPEWEKDYGVDPTNPSEPWPVLCNKLSFVGGQTAGIYAGLAAQHGFDVILDRPTQAAYQLAHEGANNVAGCMTAGRAMVLATAPLTPCVTPCAYGPASAYPDPAVMQWGADRTGIACPVPGSSLGQGAGCVVAGAYSTPDISVPSLKQAYVGPCALTPLIIFPIPTTPGIACEPGGVTIPGPLAQLAINVSTSGSTSTFDASYDQLDFLNQPNIKPAHAALVFNTVA